MTLLKFENATTEYKSLKKVEGKNADLKDLAKTCVCMANAQGGYLIIGIEDKAKVPPCEQKIDDKLINTVIKKLRSFTDSVGLVNPETHTHENGGEYFSIQIHPSLKTIATTSEVLDYLGEHYELTQKEIIALGVIVREKKISGFDLTHLLQLANDDRLRSWLNNLIKKEIVITEGKTKGKMYMINPKILSSLDHDLKPSLKTMSEYALKALIKEDLKIHPKSKISEIHSRLDDLELSYLRRVVYKMFKNKELEREGIRSNMVYFLAK